MQNAVVVKNYISEFPIPVQFHKDEKVTVIKRDTAWVGWMYCKNEVSIERWIPLAYLISDKDSPEIYRLTIDYNPVELSVKVGDRVKIEKKESGWAWIENFEGEFGWVPLENLKMI